MTNANKPTPESCIDKVLLGDHLKAPVAKAASVEHTYALTSDLEFCDDELATFVSDRELVEGTIIHRGAISRRSASSFLPDANDVLEHMANSAADDNSEFCDGFPNTTPEQEAELADLLAPLQAWADRSIKVTFYSVPSHTIEPYTVTAEDVAAGEAYRKGMETTTCPQ